MLTRPPPSPAECLRHRNRRGLETIVHLQRVVGAQPVHPDHAADLQRRITARQLEGARKVAGRHQVRRKLGKMGCAVLVARQALPDPTPVSRRSHGHHGCGAGRMLHCHLDRRLRRRSCSILAPLLLEKSLLRRNRAHQRADRHVARSISRCGRLGFCSCPAGGFCRCASAAIAKGEGKARADTGHSGGPEHGGAGKTP